MEKTTEKKGRPSKREWINAYLDGLEGNRYSGRVSLTLEWNKGGLSRLVVMRQDPVSEGV